MQDQNTCPSPGAIISQVLCHILGSCVLHSYTVDIGIPTFFLVNSEWQCDYLS